MKPQIIEFQGTFCYPEFFDYTGGYRGINLIDSITGERYLTISIDPYDYYIEKDEIIIKSYDNCIGIDRILYDLDILTPTEKTVKSNSMTCRIFKIK